MREVKGDILTVLKGYICHQVNTSGVMGAGIALQIKNKWPNVYKRYKEFCKIDGINVLGEVQIIRVGAGLFIVNIFGQRLGVDSRPTRYDAVVDAFELLQESTKDCENLYVPKNMGCALGGGVWPIYSSIIEYYFPKAIVVDYLPGKKV